MSARFVLGRENVPCIAEVVNRSLKADRTDFSFDVRAYVFLAYRNKLYMAIGLPLQTSFSLLTQDGYGEKYSNAFYPQVFP